jgi:outer membrane receptor protein involved in Fe transport
LDLSAQVKISQRMTANVEAFNLTNESLYEYEGAKTRARNYSVYGRTYAAGLTYKF